MNTNKLIIPGVIILLLVLLFAGGCNSYNGMVSASQAVDRQWAQVENQYQRRADLIPNLVNTVKGYASHESSTLEAVTEARAGLSKAYTDAQTVPADQQDIAAFQRSQDALQKSLGIYINAVREAYPDLKANENFLNLQAQLEGTENRIATERTRYNDEVQAYNTSILRFPANIFANIFGFQKRDMFSADPEAQKAPKVEF